ncbi:MAG: HNH endonuclease [Methylococcales bacterium]|nr:HNH endonuclease [Methylococcales bacterium]
MNPLQRVLIEKAGHEHGFENVISGPDNEVLLGSARHRTQASISLHDDTWLLAFSSGLLSGELARSFPNVERFNGKFVATSLDKLEKLLRRAAALAQSLPNQAVVDYEKQVNKALAELPKNGTEIERMVRQRVGQNTFRSAMMDYWGSACAVTGITFFEVLRASHAKPWANCVSDAERLDVFNGFLLSANLDALFDRFLITFNDDGTMLVSSKLTMDQRISLGLNSAFSLRWVAKEHKHYLQYHRTIFIEGF